MDLARALDVAIDAARAAGALLLADFHRPDGRRGHGDKAEADVEAENLIRARLLGAFQGWRFLGEETGGEGGDAEWPPWRGAFTVWPSLGAATGRERGDAESPLCLIDPNDATRDYLRGARGSAV